MVQAKISQKMIEEVATQVAGEDVKPLLKILKNKKNISEFKLAEEANQEINLTRNQLYRLYHSNLVTFTRKKDKQKGWYIYYWTFNNHHVPHVMNTLRKNRLTRLKERLEKEEQNQFFLCENACARLTFEQAMEFDYKCPECAFLLNQQDNAKTISYIQNEIKKLEKEL